MLPFENRIKKKKDFALIFEKGKFHNLDTVNVIILKNNTQKTRFGFIVSKKVSLKSVSRNKIKRTIREQTRLILNEIKQGFDILIIAKKETMDYNFKEISNDLKNLFNKQGILK